MNKRTRRIAIGMVLVCLLVMLVGCSSMTDSLQHVEVSFSGYNGNGQADAVLHERGLIESVIGSKPKSLDTLDEWLFEYDALWMGLDVICVPEDGLSNGDTIEVTVTVSGLDAYLMDANLLSEVQIREIIDQYVPVSGEEDIDFWSYSEPVYNNTYFCIGDIGAIGVDINRLMVLVCCDAYMNGSYRQTNYVPLVFRNVILSANGEVQLDYENGTTEIFFTNPNSMVAYLEEDYSVVEVHIEYCYKE